MRQLFSFALVWLLACGSVLAADSGHPNILWITSEDHGPEMGCYGDSFATTPHVDALASKGMLFKLGWSCAPVCAAAGSAPGAAPASSNAARSCGSAPRCRAHRECPPCCLEKPGAEGDPGCDRCLGVALVPLRGVGGA